MYEFLKHNSILLIGERYPTRIAWRQMYDARTDSLDEEETRALISSVGISVFEHHPPPGSARKIIDDWKVLYYEITPVGGTRSTVYCLLSKAPRIPKSVKMAMRSVSERGGVYSPKRFYQEFLDLLEDEKGLNEEKTLTLRRALDYLESSHGNEIDANFIGRLINLINRSIDIDNETLERIYFLAYEMLLYLEQQDRIDIDIDVGLDGAYTVAEQYREREVFHLALELYKRIVPLAKLKNRTHLAISSTIKIAILYHKHFPMSEEIIINTLQEIKEKQLKEASQQNQEIYYCLLGESYRRQGKVKLAKKYFMKGINAAEMSIAEPKWMIRAYDFLGWMAQRELYPNQAMRNYLTAASLAFSIGDLSTADSYMSLAAEQQMTLAYWEITAAAMKRVDDDTDSAEYFGWNALRILLWSYLHLDIRHRYKYIERSKELLEMAQIILSIKGKRRRYLATIRKVKKLVELLQLQTMKPTNEKSEINKLIQRIEVFIPAPPPTFLLIANDGRMIASAKVTDEGCVPTDLESVVFSGILTAIMALLSEVSDSSLRTIDAGNFKIIIERDPNVVSVLLVDRDQNEYRDKLKNILQYINRNFKSRVRRWDGKNDIVPPILGYVHSVLNGH